MGKFYDRYKSNLLLYVFINRTPEPEYYGSDCALETEINVKFTLTFYEKKEADQA